MELFLKVAIGIVIFLVIIVVVAIIVWLLTSSDDSSTSTTSTTCVNQNDCKTGYVCTDAKVCKAGLGITCSVDDDCATDFICDPTNKVCTGKEFKGTSSIQPAPPAPPVQQNLRQRRYYPPPPPAPTQQQVYYPSPQSPVDTNFTVTYDNYPMQVNTYQPPLGPFSLGHSTSVSPTPQIYHPQQYISPVNNSPVNNQQYIPQYIPPVNNTQDVPQYISQDSSQYISQLSSDKDNSYSTVPTVFYGSNPKSITDIFQAQRQTSSYCSTDDEINSCGLKSSSPFHIASGASTAKSPTSEISTPCLVEDEINYCKRKKDNSVIDVCSYSTSTVFLLDDGKIILEMDDKKRRKISSNIIMKKITSFAGYLYALSDDGDLYTLPNNLLESDMWTWDICQWAPNNITHISSTQDSNNLWIQSKGQGYIYNGENSLKSRNNYTHSRRIYGKDLNNYIDINDKDNTAIVTPGQAKLCNIYDAALSYYGDVVSISVDEKDKYKSVTIVNWQPYYIEA